MQLTNRDFKRWFDALASQPATSREFMPWIETKLHAFFFSFDALFLAHCNLIAGQIKTTHWLATGHTSQFLHQLLSTFELGKVCKTPSAACLEVRLEADLCF